MKHLKCKGNYPATMSVKEKGLDLNITGKSNRGTTTNDKYTLKGFTLAFNKLNQEC